MQEDDEEQLKKALEEVQDQGIALFLEGMPASPQTIADKCLKEDAMYMADYVADENGKWKELRYDRVLKWK